MPLNKETKPTCHTCIGDGYPLVTFPIVLRDAKNVNCSIWWAGYQKKFMGQ